MSRQNRLKNFIVMLIIGVFIVSDMGTVATVQAASMSYSKALRMYSKAEMKWLDRRTTKKITDDLRLRSGWGDFNTVGKKARLSHTYALSDMSYYMCKDLNGDGVPEKILGLNGGQLLILTIHKNKVKILAFIQNTSVTPSIYYNKRNKTFMIAASINPRSTSRNVYKIRKGKLYRLTILSDYVCSMDKNGRMSVFRYINGKRTSKSRYRKYYKKYCKNMKLLRWKYSQE